jgi:hypothetical protein
MKQFLPFSRAVNAFANAIAYLLMSPPHLIKTTHVAYAWKRNQLTDAAETMHMLDDKKKDLLI